MATLKIGNAHNEAGQKFFASDDLTSNSIDLLWKNSRVLTESSFTVSGDFTGNGTVDSPLSWKGFKAENAEGAALSEVVKTIKAGKNVTLSAQEGTLTISSEGSVKSVNGQLPDESGNVTIETGGGMTARLVSGEVAASAGEWLVFTAAGSVTLPAGANLSEVKITAETAGVSVFPASGEAVAGDNGLSLDMPGYTVLLQFRETARNWVPVEITAARPSVLASSEEKPAIPDDGLVFYVPLESAEAATGQPIGNNGVTFTPDAVLGRDVAVFDGSANLSFTPTGMPSGTAPHTKSLWIKFNGDTGQVYVLAWGSNGSDSASTITARNNKWAWCFAGDWEETDVDVPAGQWLNVTTTHSAGVNKLYVNGTLRNTHSRNLNVSGTSGTIGSFLSGSEKITGALAALRVYDRVLTADEIAALAAEFTI